MTAQPEHDPAATIAVRWHEPVGKVAFVLDVNLPVGIHKVYTNSPQRTWVGLTSVDWNDFNAVKSNDPQYVAAWAEAKLKEKNT